MFELSRFIGNLQGDVNKLNKVISTPTTKLGETLKSKHCLSCYGVIDNGRYCDVACEHDEAVFAQMVDSLCLSHKEN